MKSGAPMYEVVDHCATASLVFMKLALGRIDLPAKGSLRLSPSIEGVALAARKTTPI